MIITTVLLFGVSVCLVILGIFTVQYIVLALGILLIVLLLSSVLRSKALISSYASYKDQKLEDLKARIGSVIPEISMIPIYGSNQSFTINKKTIYICLKDDAGQYYPDNMLTYVILHELAHVMCPEAIPQDQDQHTPMYMKVFNGLLHRAEREGIYDSSIPVIEDYCGYGKQ